MKPVSYSDIEAAYSWVNDFEWSDNYAVISKITGEILYNSGDGDTDEIPEEAEGSDDYVWFPDKRDLDLGQKIVWDFVREYIPDDYDEVRYIFSGRGAYRMYRDFLSRKDLLKTWWEFEAARKKTVLLEWCKEEGIEVAVETEA